jgi:hypothetical protein
MLSSQIGILLTKTNATRRSSAVVFNSCDGNRPPPLFHSNDCMTSSQSVNRELTILSFAHYFSKTMPPGMSLRKSGQVWLGCHYQKVHSTLLAEHTREPHSTVYTRIMWMLRISNFSTDCTIERMCTFGYPLNL